MLEQRGTVGPCDKSAADPEVALGWFNRLSRDFLALLFLPSSAAHRGRSAAVS